MRRAELQIAVSRMAVTICKIIIVLDFDLAPQSPDSVRQIDVITGVDSVAAAGA